MNNNQIEILRGLIQREIELALEVNAGSIWGFETEQRNDKYWEEFAKTFQIEEISN